MTSLPDNIIECDAIEQISSLIEIHRKNAYRKVNEELISMYWEVGEYLSAKVREAGWGSKVISSIADELKDKYPGLKGFNRPGLYRMMQFYDMYKDAEIVSTLLRQLGWSSHLLIMSGTKSMEEKIFYMKMCIENNYSVRELNRQIDSGYYQRYLLSEAKAAQNLLPSIDEDDIPVTRLLDTYVLEFLDLPNEYSEKDLRKSIVHNIKDFILEIGKDFTFVGEEYRVQVGNHDYYIDLLFYNRTYSCLVAFELKIGEFKPEYISKMNLYLEALDRHEKKNNENPSVGLILCTSKDDAVVEYASSRSISQTAVAEYSLNIIDKKLLEDKLKQLSGMLIDREGD